MYEQFFQASSVFCQAEGFSALGLRGLGFRVLGLRCLLCVLRGQSCGVAETLHPGSIQYLGVGAVNVPKP